MRSLMIFFALGQFLLLACDFPSILSSENQAASVDEADAVRHLLVVRTTGGFAGVDTCRCHFRQP